MPEKNEMKPFGLSQHVNRIDSNFDGTAVVPSIKEEYNGKQYSSSEDDATYSDESEIWLKRCSYVYNSRSGTWFLFLNFASQVLSLSCPNNVL